MEKINLINRCSLTTSHDLISRRRRTWRHQCWLVYIIRNG